MTSNTVSGFGKSTDNAFNLDVDHLNVNQGEDISGTATFNDDVIFNGDITFEGHVQFNDDVDVTGNVTADSFIATAATNQYTVQNASAFDFKVSTSTTPVFRFLDSNNSLSTSTIEANIINATTINNTKTISSDTSNTTVTSSQKNTSISAGAESGYKALNSDNTSVGIYMQSTAGGKRGKVRSSSDAFGLDIITEGYGQIGSNKSIKLYTDHTTIDSALSCLKGLTVYGASEFQNAVSFLGTGDVLFDGGEVTFERYTNFNNRTFFNAISTFEDQAIFNADADFYGDVTMDDTLVVLGLTETQQLKVNEPIPAESSTTGAFQCNGGISVSRKSYFKPNFEIPAGYPLPLDSILGAVVFQNPIFTSVDEVTGPFVAATVYIKGPPALAADIDPANQILACSLVVEAQTQLDKVFVTGDVTIAGALTLAGLATLNGATILNGSTTINGSATFNGSFTIPNSPSTVVIKSLQSIDMQAGSIIDIYAKGTGLTSKFRSDGNLLLKAATTLTTESSSTQHTCSTNYNIDVTGLSGKYEVESKNTIGLTSQNLLKLESTQGDVQLKSHNDMLLDSTTKLDLKSASAMEITSEFTLGVTASDDMTFSSKFDKNISMTTNLGTVSLVAVGGAISATSGGGQIEINTKRTTGVGGKALILTGGGNVEINAAKTGQASGDLLVDVGKFDVDADDDLTLASPKIVTLKNTNAAGSLNVFSDGNLNIESKTAAKTMSVKSAGPLTMETPGALTVKTTNAGEKLLIEAVGDLDIKMNNETQTMNIESLGLLQLKSALKLEISTKEDLELTSSENNLTLSAPKIVTVKNTNSTGKLELLSDGDLNIESKTPSQAMNIKSAGGLTMETPGLLTVKNTNVASKLLLQSVGDFDIKMINASQTMNIDSLGQMKLKSAARLEADVLAGGMSLKVAAGALDIGCEAGITTVESKAGALNLSSSTPATPGAILMKCMNGPLTFVSGDVLTPDPGVITFSTPCEAGAVLFNLFDPTNPLLSGGAFSVVASIGAINLSCLGGVINLLCGVGVINLTALAGSIQINAVGVPLLDAIKIGSGVGNITIASGTGAMNLLADQGGINVGCTGEGDSEMKPIGHFIVRTVNNAFASGTANIKFTTHKTGILEGPGNFTVDTSGGFLGNIFFRSRGSFQVVTDNGSETGGVYFNTVASNSPGEAWTWKFPNDAGLEGQVLTSGGSNINPALAYQTWTTVTKPDANGNVSANNFFSSFFTISNATPSPYNMTAASPAITYSTRTGAAENVFLPDATTLPKGATFYFNINGTATINVKRFGSGTVGSLLQGTFTTFELTDNSTAAGTWDHHHQTPGNVDWTNTELTFPQLLTSTNTQVATYTGLGISAAVWTAGGYGGKNAWLTQDLTLQNGTSGSYVALKAPSTGFVSNYTMTLPISVGTVGQMLTSQGPGTAMTWTTAGTGTVTSIGMSVPTFLSVSPSTITTSGTFAVTLSGTALPVVNGGTGVTTSTGSGSLVLSTTPTFTSGIVLEAATSGNITFNSPATVTSYSFIPPTTAGTAGQVLTSAEGSTMTWTTPTIGTVTSVGMSVPSFLSVSPSTITSSGTFAVTLSGTALPVENGGTGSTLSVGGGPVMLANSPSVYNGMQFLAATSGYVVFIPPATVTTYSFIPPTTAGTAGQVLTSGAGSTMTWTTPTTGTVTSVGMSVPTFLTVSPSTITTSGTFAVTLSGTALPVVNGGTGTTTSTGSGSVVLSSSPVFSTGASNVISLTPATTNGECGILFNSQTTSGSGARWVLGQNVASSGADTFALYSTSTSASAMIVANSGVTTFRSFVRGLTFQTRPSTNGGESSMYYFSNTDFTGTYWVTGQNVASGGANTYCIYSDTAAKNIMLMSTTLVTSNTPIRLTGSVAGFVTIKAPDSNTGYTFTLPSLRGTIGQVLTSDGTGATYWSVPSSGGSAFTTPVTCTLGGISSQIPYIGLVPSLATGNNVSIQFGASASTNNNAVIYFKNTGGTGSALNELIFGLYNNDYLSLQSAGAYFYKPLNYNVAGTGSVVVFNGFQTALGTGNAVEIKFGKLNATNDSAYMVFLNNGGAGSAANRLQIGLSGSQSLSLAPANGMSTFSTTLTIPQVTGVNNAINIFPTTAGNEASILFGRETSNTGDRWVLGQNVNGAGANTFGLYSTTFGQNAYVITNTACTTSIPAAGTKECNFFAPGLTTGQQANVKFGVNGTTGGVVQYLYSASNPEVNIGLIGATSLAIRNTQMDIGRSSTSIIFTTIAALYQIQFKSSIRSAGYRPASQTFHFQFTAGLGGSDTGNITDNGSNITYSSSSDYRLKTNVQPITNALDRISMLNPCTFTWVSGDQTEGEGFIAHELAAIVPTAVQGEKDALNEDGSIKAQGVDYSRLTPILTKAVQELLAKIELLESRIAILEST